MASTPLFIMLCSGEHEKIQMAAMTASVGAVSDRPVRVFVSMDAILAFEKGKTPNERYKGGHFSKLFLENNVPDAMELFRQGKLLGDLRVYACSLVLDLKHWELENLEDDIFDERMGLTMFLNESEEGELIAL